MQNRALLALLLLFSWSAIAQTQYGTPAAPHGAGSAPAHGHGQAACPWLTEGSAAHALGGDVTVTVNITNTGEGSCRFSRSPESQGALQILVSKAAIALCPAESMKLAGIGNEAARCRLSNAHGETTEMVSSRVRDTHFSVTLVSRAEKSAKALDPHDDALEQIAEQVAGNLY